MTAISRYEQRWDMPVERRIALAENDLDQFERAVIEQGAAIKRLTRVGVGILVSLATSSIMLALNLIQG